MRKPRWQMPPTSRRLMIPVSRVSWRRPVWLGMTWWCSTTGVGSLGTRSRRRWRRRLRRPCLWCRPLRHPVACLGMRCPCSAALVSAPLWDPQLGVRLGAELSTERRGSLCPGMSEVSEVAMPAQPKQCAMFKVARPWPIIGEVTWLNFFHNVDPVGLAPGTSEVDGRGGSLRAAIQGAGPCPHVSDESRH